MHPSLMAVDFTLRRQACPSGRTQRRKKYKSPLRLGVFFAAWRETNFATFLRLGVKSTAIKDTCTIRKRFVLVYRKLNF